MKDIIQDLDHRIKNEPSPSKRICEAGFQVNYYLLTQQNVPLWLSEQLAIDRTRYWLEQPHDVLTARAKSWMYDFRSSLPIGLMLEDKVGLERDIFWLDNDLRIINAAVAKGRYDLLTASVEAEDLLRKTRIAASEISPHQDFVLLDKITESSPEYINVTGNKLWKWIYNVKTRAGIAPAEVIVTAVGINKDPEARKGILCAPISIGCPAGCRMCQIGETNIQQLSANQMLTMVLRTASSFSHPRLFPEKTKYSWLGGGDPAFNLVHFAQAVRTMHRLYPESPQVISTVGISPGSLSTLIDLSDEVGNASLQLSLLSFDEATRRALIPLKSILPVQEGIDILNGHWRNKGKKSYISIILFEGMNDNPELNTQRLKELGADPAGLHITIDIPQVVSDSSLRAASRDTVLQTKYLLEAEGYEVGIYETPEYAFTESGCGVLSPQTRKALMKLQEEH